MNTAEVYTVQSMSKLNSIARRITDLVLLSQYGIVGNSTQSFLWVHRSRSLLTDTTGLHFTGSL